MAQSNLPPCQGEERLWTDCFGTTTLGGGLAYVGFLFDGVNATTPLPLETLAGQKYCPLLRDTRGGVASRSDTVVPAQIQNKENWGYKKCLQIFWGAISCNPAYLKVTG